MGVVPLQDIAEVARSESRRGFPACCFTNVCYRNPLEVSPEGRHSPNVMSPDVTFTLIIRCRNPVLITKLDS